METHDILTDLEWMMVMAALEDDDKTEDESGDEECDEAGDVLQTSSSFRRLMIFVFRTLGSYGGFDRVLK